MKHITRIIAISLALFIGCAFTLPAQTGMLESHAASKIKINKTKAAIAKGSTLQLKITGTKKKFKWSSSKKSVATVSSKGKVTAYANGTAVISARQNNMTFKCTIYVGTTIYSDTNIRFIYTGQNSQGITFAIQNNMNQSVYTKINSVALDGQQVNGSVAGTGKKIPAKKAASLTFKCKPTDSNYKHLALGGYCQSWDSKYFKYFNFVNKVIGDTPSTKRPPANTIPLINNSRIKIEYIDTTAQNLHFQVTNKSTKEIVLSTEKMMVALDRETIWYEDYAVQYIAPKATAQFIYKIDENNQAIQNLAGRFDFYYPDNFNKMYKNNFDKDIHQEAPDLDGIE